MQLNLEDLFQMIPGNKNRNHKVGQFKFLTVFCNNFHKHLKVSPFLSTSKTLLGGVAARDNQFPIKITQQLNSMNDTEFSISIFFKQTQWMTCKHPEEQTGPLWTLERALALWEVLEEIVFLCYIAKQCQCGATGSRHPGKGNGGGRHFLRLGSVVGH